MEWVEVRGSSVEVAVEAALAELGLSSRDQASIEIVEEPSRGFLGMGSREALVRVSAKPKTEKRPRRRKRGNGGDRGQGRSEGRKQTSGSGRGDGKRQQGGRGGNRSGGGQGGGDRTPRKTTENKKEASGAKNDGRSPRQEQRKSRTKERTMDEATTPEVEIDAEGQAAVVAEFLNGLLDSFGLEGEVTTDVDDDLIIADVAGEQTEALIGQKGSIMQSVGELTRTVVQRKTHRRARLRLDIGGYQERRREALRIYTGRLAEQVLDDGGEIMLEPMNPADRKTVHDAVVTIEGVSSFSEGEEPNRSVVIGLAPGVKPRAGKGADESDETAEDSDETAEEAGDSDETAEDSDETVEEAGDSDETAEDSDETVEEAGDSEDE